jgi:hypothetical protein
MPDPRPCRKCKAKIEFIEGPNGRAIPVQKVTQLYVLDRAEKLVKANVVTPLGAYDPGPFYISHFQTCPAAETFTRNRS